MRYIDMHKPTCLQNVIGNAKTLSRIRRAVNHNDGFGGLVLMLTGRTGNGKTLIADLIASKIDGELYRPDCTKDAETAQTIDQMKRHVGTRSLYATQSVYILDEADQLHPSNVAKLKTVIDQIDRRRQAGDACYVTVIFTSAKTKEQLTKDQQKHWDELSTRCVTCDIGVTDEEMDSYFATLTGGKVKDISKRISVKSMRAAWDYLDNEGIEIADVEEEDDD
jgi:Cdc6-like AAA superfamily ATPase